ncbi:MAG: serine/threonine protein kinase [Deltaproteobacteria bacterium]|nr:serine/threonine protein kinase [Deltaproteobacteria bacterium]
MINLPNQTAQEHSRWSANELIPFGKYLLLDRISIGATAAVYRGIAYGEAGFERLAALKRILPHMAGDQEFISTFIQEAKTAARLTHTNICPIFELGKVGESMYMAMECIIGKDLGRINQTLIKKGIHMPPSVAAWMASKMCEALDYAHNLKNLQGEQIGFIHRDLSPANILISYEGDVKLIDFGVAKAVGQAQQTNVDALKKKLSYMSPEMVKGKRLDARSDIFGVGVCLYEMVTSKQLFAGNNDVAVLKLVSQASVPPPSALLEDPPEELEMILMRALEREPDDRWQSADEMNTALQSYLSAEHPGFGVRQLSTWMEEIFETEKEAEQARLNELLEASKNPNIIAERRRFFSSPMGAAAITRAEVINRMRSVSRVDISRDSSEVPTIPPPPKVPSLAKPSADLKELDEEIEELDDMKNPPVEERAESAAHRFSSQPTVINDTSEEQEGFVPPEKGLFAPAFKYETEFDEDATEIFFNKEEEIGLDELYRDRDKSEGPAVSFIQPAAIQRAPGAQYQILRQAPAQYQARYMPAPAAPRVRQARIPTVQMQLSSTPWWKSGWALSLCVGLITIAVTMFIYMQLLRQPSTGSIVIRTTPAIPATVMLDGIERGRTPMRMDGVPVGKRTLEIRAEGYRPIARQVDLTKNATAILEFSLVSTEPKISTSAVKVTDDLTASDAREKEKSRVTSQANELGMLSINSVPWARVFIDDKDTGRITPIVSFPIRAGTYNVGLRTPDDKLHIEKITINAGETTEISRDFTK